MICKPCGVAGDMVVLFRGKNHDGTVLPVANMLHGMCNNCDCQHKIDFEGKTVQKESENGGETARESTG